MRKLLLTIALLALPGIAMGQGGTPAGAYNTGAGGSSNPALGQVVQTGLMAEYRVLPTESAAALVDYSTGGNSAVGTVGTAPTIAAITGGLVCGGTGAVKLPAALNSALTMQLFVSFQPSTITSQIQTNGIVQGNGASSIALVLYTQNNQDTWGTSIAGGARFRSASSGTYKSSSLEAFSGTGVMSLLLDTNDRFFINTQEASYVQTGTSAGLQTNGQHQLCGVTPNYLTGTIYYAVFYSRVLTTAEVAQNVQFITNAMAARNVAVSPYPTDGNNSLVCNGDSLTAGGTTWCAGLGFLSSPSAAVTNNQGLLPSYSIADQGLNGAGGAIANVANYAVDTLYRPAAANNLDALWIGTNDNNALVTYPLIRKNCTERRRVGWKCIVGTMVSRTGEDVTKNQLNALLRGHWTEFADGLMDFAANPNLGADGAFSNVTYFTDGIHLTATGNNIVSAIGKRVGSRVFGNGPSSSSVITAPPQFQFVQGATTNCGATATNCTVAFPANNTVGNFIFLAVLGTCCGTGAIGTPTDTRANTYTSVVGPTAINGAQNMQSFFVANIPAGANTVTVPLSGTGNNAMLMVAEYSGVATATPLDATSTLRSFVVSPITTNSVTTTAVNELLITYGFTASMSAATTFSAAQGYSLRLQNSNTGTGGAITDTLSGATGAYQGFIAYTGAQQATGSGIAAFKIGTPAGTYVMADQDVVLYCNPSANTTAVNTTVQLPDAVGLTGQTVTVKSTQNAGASTCTVSTTNSQTIDGATTFTLANKAAAVFLSVLTSPTTGGANWIQVNF